MTKVTGVFIEPNLNTEVHERGTLLGHVRVEGNGGNEVRHRELEVLAAFYRKLEIVSKEQQKEKR